MKKLLLFLCITFVFAPTFQSCKIFQPIQITSPFSAELVRDTKDLAFSYDLFSVTILESTDKSYDTYVSEYNSMEVLAGNIKARVDAMPKSGLMQRQANDVVDILTKYKEYHKSKIKLNDSEIRTNRTYFKDHVQPLLVSAMALK